MQYSPFLAMSTKVHSKVQIVWQNISLYFFNKNYGFILLSFLNYSEFGKYDLYDVTKVRPSWLTFKCTASNLFIYLYSYFNKVILSFIYLI